MGTEIEAKFLVTTGISDRIRGLAALGSYALLEGTTEIVQDAYLDTADRTLLSAGYVCRCRQREAGRLISVKSTASSSGAIHRREELEVVIADDSAPDSWPQSEARERVLALVGTKPLEEMFRLKQVRHVRSVVEGTRHVADCSLDEVSVGEGAKEHHWVELEVELAREGTEADLAAMSGWLRKEIGLQPSIGSKFETALDALSESRGAPRRAPPRSARRRARAAAEERNVVLEGPEELAGNLPVSALTVMGYTVKERRRREDTLSFFDTPDGAFMKQGFTVVLSRSSGTWSLCEGDEVKAEQDGRPSTPPREGESAGISPTVPYLDADLVETDYAVGGLVAHLLRIRAQQWTFRVPLEESAPKILLRIVVSGPSTPCVYFSSLLQSRLGCRIQSMPLVETGLALLGGSRPGAPLPSRFRVSPDDSVAQACSRILRGEAWKMRANVRGATADLDVEFVHDLRVATRRARSALRLFSRIVDPEDRKSLAGELAWIAALLGAVRDVDVLLGRLGGHFERIEAGSDFRGIVGQGLRDRRARSQSQLVEALQSERFSRLVQRLETWGGTEADLRAPVDEDRPGEQPVRRFARARIDKAFAKLAPWIGRSSEDLTDAELHRIRILFKRLRYTCEFFRPLLGERVGDLVGSFVGFQDCLGLHQDAATALRILSSALAEVPHELRAEEFLFASGALLQVQRDIRGVQREEFARRWMSASELVDLWKDLRGALGETA